MWRQTILSNWFLTPSPPLRSRLGDPWERPCWQLASNYFFLFSFFFNRYKLLWGCKSCRWLNDTLSTRSWSYLGHRGGEGSGIVGRSAVNETLGSMCAPSIPLRCLDLSAVCLYNQRLGHVDLLLLVAASQQREQTFGQQTRTLPHQCLVFTGTSFPLRTLQRDTTRDAVWGLWVDEVLMECKQQAERSGILAQIRCFLGWSVIRGRIRSVFG